MTTTEAVSPLKAIAGLGSAMAVAREAFTRLWQLDEPGLVEALKAMHCLGSEGSALELTVIREVDTRGVATSQGAGSTKAFLMGALTMSARLAGEKAAMSEALTTRFTDTCAALAQGEIAPEQAKAIVDVVNGLPKCATVEDKAWAEGLLLEHAHALNATDLRGLAKTLDNRIDPDGSPEREEAARSKRGLAFRTSNDGTQKMIWTDTDENMALAKAAIGALAAPMPAADGTRDPRSAPVRQADAMVEIFQRVLGIGDLPARHEVRPHLTVMFTEATLRNEPGAPYGRTSTGEDVSPEVIERLLCDADITGILIDGEGVPLKLGRTRRTVSKGQWKAITVRDVGCVFPGCTRPAEWTEAHHSPPWTQDGQTDLDKLHLFCGIHHPLMHKGWTVRRAADGHAEIIPPKWVDFEQRPRRNLHWQLLRELHNRTAHTTDDP